MLKQSWRKCWEVVGAYGNPASRIVGTAEEIAWMSLAPSPYVTSLELLCWEGGDDTVDVTESLVEVLGHNKLATLSLHSRYSASIPWNHHWDPIRDFKNGSSRLIETLVANTSLKRLDVPWRLRDDQCQTLIQILEDHNRSLAYFCNGSYFCPSPWYVFQILARVPAKLELQLLLKRNERGYDYTTELLSPRNSLVALLAMGDASLFPCNGTIERDVTRTA